VVHRTWPFVGREQLVGDLPARLDAGRHIILNGPAGLGKTRLAQHISDLYAVRGHPVRRIVATPGSPLALAPFATLLGAEAAAPSGDAVVAVRRALGRGLGQAGVGTAVPVLVVDDLHLLDDASATVVHQLLAGGSVRLLATQRSGAPAPPAVDRLRQEPGVEHVELPPLGDDQIIAMVEAALGAPLAGHARQLVASSAAGNPMYARELVEGSLAAGALARHGGVFDFDARMVATALLEEVVLARLADFQGLERTAIEVLALGGRLDAALLERIVGLPALETLERSEVVVATAWGPEPRGVEASGRHTAGGARSARPEVLVDLAHPLYRELTRARLGNLARMRLYRTLADASVATAADPTELQSITWQVRGGRSVAPEVLTAAAHRAIGTGNSPLAAELALEAAQVTGTTEAALLASWCHSLNGDHATSIELLRAALPREADPWACAAIRLRIAEEHWWTGDLAAGQAVLDEAAAEDGPGAALAAAQRSAHAVLAGFPGRPSPSRLTSSSTPIRGCGSLRSSATRSA